MTYDGQPPQQPQYPQYPPAGYQPTQQYQPYQPPADQAWHPPVGYPTPPGLQPRATKPHVKRHWVVPASVGLVALLIGIGIGIGGKSADAKSGAASVVTTTATTTVAPTATTTLQITTTPTQVVATKVVTKRVIYTPPPVHQFSDGTYLVGRDIPAGLYHTDDQGGGVHCYWERDKDLNGSLDSIAANDNIDGPTTVKVSASDAAFKTDGGCTWSKIG